MRDFNDVFCEVCANSGNDEVCKKCREHSEFKDYLSDEDYAPDPFYYGHSLVGMAMDGLDGDFDRNYLEDC